jgi:hypothetical protein
VNNQSWARNEIREGTAGCFYVNAYNNQESPAQWLQMAGHEDLANCRIRCMPRRQGGGPGIYALDDIWNRQELLRSILLPHELEEITEDLPAPAMKAQGDNRTTTEDLAEEGEDAAEAHWRSLGHQYTTCNDTGGWRMHEPNQL